MKRVSHLNNLKILKTTAIIKNRHKIQYPQTTKFQFCLKTIHYLNEN